MKGVFFRWLACFSLLAVSINAEPAEFHFDTHDLAEPTASFAPLTFGHVFPRGEIHDPNSLQLSNEETDIEVQIDPKSHYDDGSIRFAILTTVVPPDQNSTTLTLVNAENQIPSTANYTDLINLDIEVLVEQEETTYSFSPLNTEEIDPWLEGTISREYQLRGRPIGPTGEHNFLDISLNIRQFSNSDILRLSLAVGNSNSINNTAFTQNYKISVWEKGVEIWSSELKHLRHARWHQVIWTKPVKDIHVQLDVAELTKAYAIPSYDFSLKGSFSNTQTELYNQKFVNTTKTYCVDRHGYDLSCDAIGSYQVEVKRLEPMGIGFMFNYMGSSGVRAEIGPLPGWQAYDLIEQTRFSRSITTTLGDLSGSWPIHYNDPTTNRPISITNRPNASLVLNSNMPEEHVKTCDQLEYQKCVSPYVPETAHQPLLTYLPLIATGDQFYYDELLYWNSFNLLSQPAGNGYREGAQGLFTNNQVRAQAWILRTLVYSLIVMPLDSDEYREYTQILDHNLENWTQFSKVNEYGALKPYEYNDPAFAFWQDDFFTWSITQAALLGFDAALPLAEWKAQFIVGRLGYEPGNLGSFCYIYAGSNYLDMRVNREGEYYSQLNTLFEMNAVAGRLPGSANHECASESQLQSLNLDQPRLYDQYLGSPTNYVAAARLAIVSAVNLHIINADLAWSRYLLYEGGTNFSKDPIYALVPLQNEASLRPKPVQNLLVRTAQ